MPAGWRRSEKRWPRAVLWAAGLILLAAVPWAAGGGVERATGVGAAELGWGLGLFCLLLAVHGLLLLLAGWRAGKSHPPASPAPAAPPAAPGTGPRELAALAAITAAALALRLWHLDSGLWHDEIGTLLEFVRPDPGTILTSFRNQNQHMLYSLAAHACISLFGESAFALRLPAALFGAASVPALYLLARRVATAGEALLACALMAASYHHVWFSQNARGYTGVLFFTLLATWAWLGGLERNDWRRWLAYVASVALGMWVHLTMTFVVAAHGLVSLALLVAARRSPGATAPPAAASPGRALAAFALCVTVTAQLYALGLPAFFASGLHEVSLDSEWISPWWLVVETARGLAAGFSGPLLALGAVAGAAGLILLLAGFAGIWRRSAPLAVAMVLPGVLVVGLMIALRHNLWPRFLFFCAGFALLVLVRGAFDTMARVAGRRSWPARRGKILAAGTVAALVALSLASLPSYYRLPKQDYLGAKEFVEREIGPGGRAAAVGLARVAYGGLYAVGEPRWELPEDAVELERLRRRHPELRVVYTLPTHLRRWHPDVWSLLDEEFEEVRVFPGSLRGGDLHVLRPRDAADRPIGER